MDCEPTIDIQENDNVEQSIEVFEASIGETVGEEAKLGEVLGSSLENPPKYVYTRKKRDHAPRNGVAQDDHGRDATLSNEIDERSRHNGHEATNPKKNSAIKKSFKNKAPNSAHFRKANKNSKKYARNVFGKRGGKSQGQQSRISDVNNVETRPTNIAKQDCGGKNGLKKLARMRRYVSHSNRSRKEDMGSHGRVALQSSKIAKRMDVEATKNVEVGEDISSGVFECEQLSANLEDEGDGASTTPRVGWVLCDDCKKWRCIPVELANEIEATNAHWSCHQNPDKLFANCSILQEKSNAEINRELDISEDSICDEEDDIHGCGDSQPNMTNGINRPNYRQTMWTLIRKNKFQHRMRKHQDIDEAMVCHCRPSKDGNPSCGEDCLNRMLNVECLAQQCPCGSTCSNQQFQNQNYVDVELVRCGRKGFGLQVKETVCAGTFIIEYVGEIIDACAKGNLARFVNHSCDPNCRTEKWMVDGEVCIGLFAIRDLNKGEEITFDYNFVRVGGAIAKRCNCGAPNCRGFIGGHQNTSQIMTQVDSEDEEDLQPIMIEEEMEEEDGEANAMKLIDTKVDQPKISQPMHNNHWTASRLEVSAKQKLQRAREETSSVHASTEQMKRTKTSVLLDKVVGLGLKQPHGACTTSKYGNANHNNHSKPYSDVEDKLTEILDQNGGLKNHRDIAKQYLKLLVLAVASRDSTNGTPTCSVRDISMLLEALLRTTKSWVLKDIMNKNGLQMFHNLIKQFRKQWIRIPILRKVLKVQTMARKFQKDYIGDDHTQLPPTCLSNATLHESFRESPKPHRCMETPSRMPEPPGFSTGERIARSFTSKPINPKFRGRFVDNDSPTKAHIDVLSCRYASHVDVNKSDEYSGGHGHGHGAPSAPPYYTKQQQQMPVTSNDRKNKSWHVQQSFGCARIEVPPHASHQNYYGFVGEKNGNEMPQNNAAMFRFLRPSNTHYYQSNNFDIGSPPMPRFPWTPQLQRCPHPSNPPTGRPLLRYNTNNFQGGLMLRAPQPYVGPPHRCMMTLGERPVPMQQICAPTAYNVPTVANQLHVGGSAQPNNMHHIGGPPTSFANSGVYPGLHARQEPQPMPRRPPQVMSTSPCGPVPYDSPRNPLMEGMPMSSTLLRPTHPCMLRPLGPRAPFNYMDSPYSPYLSSNDSGLSPLPSSTLRPQFQRQEGYDHDGSQGFSFRSPLNNGAGTVDEQLNEMASSRASHLNPNNNNDNDDPQITPPDRDPCDNSAEPLSRLITKYGVNSRGVATEPSNLRPPPCGRVCHVDERDANIATDAETRELIDVEEARDDADCQVGGKGDTHSIGSSEEKEEKIGSTRHSWESPKDSSFRHFVAAVITDRVNMKHQDRIDDIHRFCKKLIKVVVGKEIERYNIAKKDKATWKPIGKDGLEEKLMEYVDVQVKIYLRKISDHKSRTKHQATTSPRE